MPRHSKQANSSERYCSLIHTSPQSRPSASLRRRRWKERWQLLQTVELPASARSPQMWQTELEVASCEFKVACLVEGSSPLILREPQDERESVLRSFLRYLRMSGKERYAARARSLGSMLASPLTVALIPTLASPLRRPPPAGP